MDTVELLSYAGIGFSAAFLVGTSCWGIMVIINFVRSVSS